MFPNLWIRLLLDAISLNTPLNDTSLMFLLRVDYYEKIHKARVMKSIEKRAKKRNYSGME